MSKNLKNKKEKKDKDGKVIYEEEPEEIDINLLMK